jgi:hypothetical protein
MLYDNTLKLRCAKAIFQKSPICIRSQHSLVLTAAGTTRQQALQAPLARSFSSRLDLQGTLLVNQDGFVTARLNELFCDNIATSLSAFPAVKLVTHPTGQVVMVTRYLRFFLLVPIKIPA